MESRRAGYLRDFRESWTLCQQCGACSARAPIIPHNWKDLPPPEWASPYRRCPSFEYFGFRAYSAQGRGLLATLVLDDEEFPITEDLLTIVYSCTSCGACSDVCEAVDPLTAIWVLRHELVRRGAELPGRLDRIHANIREHGNMFGPKPAADVPALPSEGEDVFFAGCGVRSSQPQVMRAVSTILKQAGIEVAYLADAERCCGFIPGYDGEGSLMEEQAFSNVEALRRAGAKRVIVSCAHCYRALTVDYPQVVGDLPFGVVHFSELLAELIAEGRLEFDAPLDETVTYHDPCFLGRHSGIYDAPRAVIEAVSGVTLKEMESNRRWPYCCGSGAMIVSLCYPEFAANVTSERLDEAGRAACSIVTGCTTCVSRMAGFARKKKLDVEIFDLSVFAARAMGIADGDG